MDTVGSFAADLALRAKPESAGRIRRDVVDFLRGRPDPTPDAIRAWLARRKSSGAGAKTLTNLLSSVRIYFNFCMRMDALTLGKNPADLVDLETPPKRPPVFLSDADLDHLFTNARSEGCWPEVALAAATGLRLGEMRRLRWTDVDLEARVVTVRVSKNGRWRCVPLSGLAIEALRGQAALALGTDHVFPCRYLPRGRRRYVVRNQARGLRYWLRTFQRIRAGIRAFSALPEGTIGRCWHMLRHTFATRLARRNIGVAKISQWLGHTSVQTTMVYVHLAAGYDPDIEDPGFSGKDI